jgi:hypothetical protein
MTIAWLAVGIPLATGFASIAGHIHHPRHIFVSVILLRFATARFLVLAGADLSMLWLLNSKIETHPPFEHVDFMEKVKAFGGLAAAIAGGAIGSLLTILVADVALLSAMVG